jgi:hypothetical protein
MLSIPNKFFLGGMALQTKRVFVISFVEKRFFNLRAVGGMA